MNHSRTNALATAVAAMAFLSAGAARAGSYTYTTIDVPGSTSTLVTGVNASGAVTGYYADAAFNTHGFTWSGGTIATFGFRLNPDFTVATAINARGAVAGEARNPHTYLARDYIRWPSGTIRALPIPEKFNPVVYGLNNAGTAVGQATIDFIQEGFIVAHGTTTPLLPQGAGWCSAQAVNDKGTVAGAFQDAAGVHGFTYAAGAFTPFDVPHAVNVTVASISEKGLVAGAVIYQRRNFGFTYDGTSIRRYMPKLAYNSWVVQAFAPGYVVGEADDAVGGGGAGFVFQDGVYTTIAAPGSGFTNVVGGTRSGTVAGYYEDSARAYHGFVAVCAAGQAPCTQ